MPDDRLQFHLPFSSPRRTRAESGQDTLVVGRHTLALRFVRHLRARRYLLRVEGNGTVRVTLPRGGTREEALDFVRKHVTWIERQRYRVAVVQPARPGDLSLAREELTARLLTLASEHGLRVRAVTVRDQRTRWGSCSPTGRISLNWRLNQAPPLVRDYVLLHELTHMEHPNHSKRFWRELERVCPWHREARAWLRTRMLPAGPG